MTDAQSVEPAESQSKKSSVSLDPMGQGELTQRWASVEACVRASLPDNDATYPVALASLRNGHLVAVSVKYRGTEIAIMVVGPVVNGATQKRGLMIHAMAGKIPPEAWTPLNDEIVKAAVNMGVSCVIAWSGIPTILTACGENGWEIRTVAVKEV